MTDEIVINLDTHVECGVTYIRRDRSKEKRDDGALIEEFTTKKTTKDPKETKKAQLLRTSISNAIRTCCVPTGTGLLVLRPGQVEDFEAAKASADKAVAVWNAQARTTHLTVNVDELDFRNPEQTVYNVTQKMAALLDEIQRGVAALDVKMVRKAAYTLKEIAPSLDLGTSESVAGAATEALKTATKIRKALAKKSDKLLDSRTYFRTIQD